MMRLGITLSLTATHTSGYTLTLTAGEMPAPGETATIDLVLPDGWVAVVGIYEDTNPMSDMTLEVTFPDGTGSIVIRGAGDYLLGGTATWRVEIVRIVVAAAQTVVLGVMGQSELEYLLNSSSFYNSITKPTITTENMIVYREAAEGSGIIKTAVTQANVTAGLVNPAMAAWSVWLNRVAPGKQFVIADLSVAGTSRVALMDDATTSRTWTAFMEMIDAVRGDGYEFDGLIECWYNSDASRAANFGPNFAPFYFGERWGGGAFTLGDENPDNTSGGMIVDHCLWDMEATSDAKGRGIFTRDRTKLHIVLPMPFADSPTDPDPEWSNYSQASRMKEPVRESVASFATDSRVQTFLGSLGPSAHITDFDGGIHPRVDDSDGQILLGWPLAVSAAREAGATIHEPAIESVEVAEDGSYADVVVDLPNGGTLTTLRAFRETADPDPLPPHWQEVIGFEITRGSTRRPVYREAATSYPAEFRGVVTIQDAGSGSPRKGKVRITPEEPFTNGDDISYLRGQASALLLEPRDVTAKVYLDMLIEHVPALYFEDDMYSLEGVAVRPYQANLEITGVAGVTAPAQMAAPTVTATGETSISATLAAAPDDGGSAIISYDLRWSTDESTWTTVTGITSPATVDSLTADTLYYVQTRAVNAVGAGAWSASGSATTDEAAGAPFFTMGATGPYFVDPSDVPSNTTRIELQARLRIPSSVTTNSPRFLFTQASQGMDIRVNAFSGNVEIQRIEDGTGTQVLTLTSLGALAKDTWIDLVVDVDQVAETVVWTATGLAGGTVNFTATSDGVFQNNREIVFLATLTGSSILIEGIEVEYVRAYFTTSGVRTLRKEIAGNAATVNADPWKMGGDAT